MEITLQRETDQRYSPGTQQRMREKNPTRSGEEMNNFPNMNCINETFKRDPLFQDCNLQHLDAVQCVIHAHKRNQDPAQQCGHLFNQCPSDVVKERVSFVSEVCIHDHKSPNELHDMCCSKSPFLNEKRSLIGLCKTISNDKDAGRSAVPEIKEAVSYCQEMSQAFFFGEEKPSERHATSVANLESDMGDGGIRKALHASDEERGLEAEQIVNARLLKTESYDIQRQQKNVEIIQNNTKMIERNLRDHTIGTDDIKQTIQEQRAEIYQGLNRLTKSEDNLKSHIIEHTDTSTLNESNKRMAKALIMQSKQLRQEFEQLLSKLNDLDGKKRAHFLLMHSDDPTLDPAFRMRLTKEKELTEDIHHSDPYQKRHGSITTRPAPPRKKTSNSPRTLTVIDEVSATPHLHSKDNHSGTKEVPTPPTPRRASGDSSEESLLASWLFKEPDGSHPQRRSHKKKQIGFSSNPFETDDIPFTGTPPSSYVRMVEDGPRYRPKSDALVSSSQTSEKPSGIPKWTAIFIGAGVGGAVVVTAIVIVAVLCLRRGNRMNRRPEREAIGRLRIPVSAPTSEESNER